MQSRRTVMAGILLLVITLSGVTDQCPSADANRLQETDTSVFSTSSVPGQGSCCNKGSDFKDIILLPAEKDILTSKPVNDSRSKIWNARLRPRSSIDHTQCGTDQKNLANNTNIPLEMNRSFCISCKNTESSAKFCYTEKSRVYHATEGAHQDQNVTGCRFTYLDNQSMLKDYSLNSLHEEMDEKVLPTSDGTFTDTTREEMSLLTSGDQRSLFLKNGKNLSREAVSALISNDQSDSVFLLDQKELLSHGTPFKIYVYDLPAKFNEDLSSCMLGSFEENCSIKVTHQGYGEELYDTPLLSIRDTWHFSLEHIIHQNLLKSPYRTTNMTEADIFYIPFYAAAACFCVGLDGDEYIIKDLFKYLWQQMPFRQGRPHFSTIGKIQREHCFPECSIFLHPDAERILFLGIEEEYFRKIVFNVNATLLVVPYPAYAHFKKDMEDRQLETPKMADRPVLMFMAASDCQANPLRVKVVDQFENFTTENFSAYVTKAKKIPNAVWYYTSECDNNNYTFDWMQKSKFCLQPPGDSPTRKSFFDAVLSGCIPVLFEHETPVKYPFDNLLDYSKFTLTLPKKYLEKTSPKLADILAQVDFDSVNHMQAALVQVAPYLQYSYPVTRTKQKDAIGVILKNVAKYFSIDP